jgi:hypothetical protein
MQTNYPGLIPVEYLFDALETDTETGAIIITQKPLPPPIYLMVACFMVTIVSRATITLDR